MPKPISPMPAFSPEILRLQRWAGGDEAIADRIFGLMRGFETTMRQESESFGISEGTQSKVEDMLQDVEAGKQWTDGPSVKTRLHRDGVDETDTAHVMELCLLQSRFPDAIDKIATGRGSVFSHLRRRGMPDVAECLGATYFVEPEHGETDSASGLNHSAADS